MVVYMKVRYTELMNADSHGKYLDKYVKKLGINVKEFLKN